MDYEKERRRGEVRYREGCQGIPLGQHMKRPRGDGIGGCPVPYSSYSSDCWLPLFFEANDFVWMDCFSWFLTHRLACISSYPESESVEFALGHGDSESLPKERKGGGGGGYSQDVRQHVCPNWMQLKKCRMPVPRCQSINMPSLFRKGEGRGEGTVPASKVPLQSPLGT